MIHVNGRSMVVMESVTERMRLKDKIVANVAKAVKSIQELQMLAGSGTITLGNEDWQCHRLCEHLDHTLLHGLRHVTPGYWNLVSEFTHKDCVKEIKRMRQVTTDLGRGRAWLFTALNENLLECYMNCFQQNESLVEEYYVRDALVRDQDRFNVLLTLTSGLENISFDLERDVPYLDLCVHPPSSKRMSNVEATLEFDRLSVCSMESVHLPSSTKHLPQTVFESPESYIPPYKQADRDTVSVGSAGSRHSPSVDSGVHSDWNYRQRSITPIDQLETVLSAEENGDASSPPALEVIRISKKGKPKHKRKKKRFVSVSSIVDSDLPDTEEATDGPVIEIPPLDDFKLLSAIQCSSQGTIKDKSLTQNLRVPGDGKESPDDKPGHVRLGSSRVGTKGGHVVAGVNGAQTDSQTKMSPNRDSGIFTDMIKARVNDIVEAGDMNTTHSDDDNGSVQYSNGDKLAEDESSELQGDSGRYEAEHSASISEDVSIYATMHDSDSSGEDFDVSTRFIRRESDGSRPVSRSGSTTLFGSGSAAARSSKTPSRASVTPPRSRSSTPVTPDKQRAPSRASIKSGEDVHVKHNQGGSRQTPDHASKDDSTASSETEHKDNSRRNTPDFLAARASRPSSAVSRASTNEMSGIDEAANQHSDTPLADVYRESPVESIDEDKVSQRSRSFNTTPDSEIAAADTALHAKVEELIEQRSLNTYTHLDFGEEEDNEEEVIDRTRCASTLSLRAGEVELDNNSMLCLMLDIVEGDDVFVRMFCCRQGHTEGKTKVVFVLVTTHSVYLLQQQATRRRFTKLSTIPFTDIDYVSLGVNNQILHIACKTKRAQYWLTTGEERITISLVDCLADSVEKSSSHPTRLEVDTGNTIQKISLQKYMARACNVEDCEVVCYSLVHWEDPSSTTGSCEWDREGPVYYKSQETTTILGHQTWKLAHAVLKDCMLCLYNDKSDSKPAQFLSISGGQCVGCKRDFNADKNNAVKVMMEDGSFWTIALATDDEANSWLQGLCQAVSEGLKMNTVRPSCIPCCMLLSQQKLLMCHEDLETNFLRTLGSASMQDVAGILHDDLSNIYLILELEIYFLRTLGSASMQDVAGILHDDLNNMYLILVFDSSDAKENNEKWVLYFNSDHECNRFKTCLSACWANHYQVAVPVLPSDDFALEKKCREMASYLKDSVSLR